MNPSVPIDSARLQAEIDELALISETPAPAVTRVIFSKEDLQAREWITRKCQEAGLETRVDTVGNLFARWVGKEPDLPAIASGSHLDAIPKAGRYDGVVGVLGALEAFRALKAAGMVPRRSLELVVFTSEEPTRFGLGCLGSRLLSGTLPVEKLASLRDVAGTSFLKWLERVDWSKDALASVPLSRGAYRAFVELHIEQGPLLEREKIDLGVVEKIAAPSSFRLRLEGVGGHAGAVLMPDRRDALTGACEIALEIEKAARASGSPDTVATTGVLRIEPNAVNSIPFRVLMEVDLRDTDVVAREWTLDHIRSAATSICLRRGLMLTYESINEDPPTVADAELVESILQHAGRAGFSIRTMVSRAYHDALFMSTICPATMIFIPCRGGISHRPDEYVSPGQIAAGVQTLAETLADWSQSLA